MKNIKKITERVHSDLTAYTIEPIGEDNATHYWMKYGTEKNMIHKLEQTKKGVYVTLWIARQDVKIFLPNTKIDIEYYD